MSPITADELLTFARTLQGQILETTVRHETFTVDVVGDKIFYTPLSSQKRRQHPRSDLENACEIYSKTHSLKPGDYTARTRNATYFYCSCYSRGLIGNGGKRLCFFHA